MRPGRGPWSAARSGSTSMSPGTCQESRPGVIGRTLAEPPLSTWQQQRVPFGKPCLWPPSHYKATTRLACCADRASLKTIRLRQVQVLRVGKLRIRAASLLEGKRNQGCVVGCSAKRALHAAMHRCGTWGQRRHRGSRGVRWWRRWRIRGRRGSWGARRQSSAGMLQVEQLGRGTGAGLQQAQRGKGIMVRGRWTEAGASRCAIQSQQHPRKHSSPPTHRQQQHCQQKLGEGKAP